MASETGNNNDVFQASNGEPANFPTGNVNLIVNSNSKGTKSVGNLTVGQFVDSQARAYGVRTFSLYATRHGANSSQKLTTTDATLPAAQFKEIEIVAKDARGRHDTRDTFQISRR